ncbi:uncharacterized protein OCT59_015210 [Rhizophagus irregularis]|uniref:uncharacterized protein n=1 Tax=Rhizophagus irregularis TaxID=588596 RepID=UPI00332EBF25|nr:hypothetical protein OCT59_015210 [Rhizophagus irregularis]
MELFNTLNFFFDSLIFFFNSLFFFVFIEENRSDITDITFYAEGVSAVKSFDPCGTLNKQYSDLVIYAGQISSNKLDASK